MIRRTLLLFCVQLLVFADSSTLPEIASYAKVSRNGATPSLAISLKDIAAEPVNQARSFSDTTISRSPVYAPSKVTKLRNGEAIDHTPSNKYSTLDRDAVAQLDTIKTRQQAQERFHPPASFEHTIAHNNAVRQQAAATETQSTSVPKFSVPSYATLPQQAYLTGYNYQQDAKTMEDNPMPASSDDYPPDSGDSYSKIPDSFQQPDVYSSDQSDTPKFPIFQSSSSYEDKYPPKPIDFPGTFDKPTFSDDLYGPHDAEHDYSHDLIFDHPPDHDFDLHNHHHHHHHPMATTTEEPEMNDQRLSKRPYSYYYIGKKLWYIPLYFSIYFIIYIAALVLKSITRHKINLPSALAAAAGHERKAHNWDSPKWLDLAKRVFDGIDMYNSVQEKLKINQS